MAASSVGDSSRAERIHFPIYLDEEFTGSIFRVSGNEGFPLPDNSFWLPISFSWAATDPLAGPTPAAANAICCSVRLLSDVADWKPDSRLCELCSVDDVLLVLLLPDAADAFAD